MNLSRLCLIALAAAALAGCGNKGPLVLPSPTDAEPVTEPAAEPAGTDAGEAAGAEPPIEPETPTEAPAEVAPPAEATPPPATDDGNGNG